MLGQKLVRALFLCALMSIVTVPSAAEARMTHAERSAVKRINHLRADRGLNKLRADGRLARAADAHSRDMLRADFFAHPSSNGTSTYDRVRHYRPSNLIGETLAYMPVVGNTSAAAIVNMWGNSPPHLAVLTMGDFRRIGVAKRRGTLFGQRVSVWTADLAN
jgi:uncharacterized protein YkwD